jgi:hypothetical protein
LLPDKSEELVRDAHELLQEHGHINFGAVAAPAPPVPAAPPADGAGAGGAEQQPADGGTPPGASGAQEQQQQEPAPAAEGGGGAAEGGEPGSGPPGERELVFKLYEVLRAADMAVTTEKMVRKSLSEAFGGLDVSEHKALIKTHVRGGDGCGGWGEC